MSRQTEQQGNNKRSYSPISPTSSVDKDTTVASMEYSSSSYDVNKTQRKAGFVIQKKAKKTPNMNSHGHAIVSPIKILKVTDKHNGLTDSIISPSSTVAISINNLLSTKQLEPVQVHSVGHQPKQQQQQAVVQSINVKTLLNTSPASTTKISSSNESNEIR
jgi:hypothetical protein